MIDEKEVLKILKRYEGRMNPTAYFGLEADIVNIEALEQEPILDKIRAEIEQKLGTHGNISLYNRAIYDVLMILDKYKAETEE